jgi:hypothetical protein
MIGVAGSGTSGGLVEQRLSDGAGVTNFPVVRKDCRDRGLGVAVDVSGWISAGVSVERVVRRADVRVAVEERRPAVVRAVERRAGAREDTVEVVFAVMVVRTEVSLSLSSSSDSSSGGGERIVFLRRLGEDCTGEETGTAEAERRVPATADVRVWRAILCGQRVYLF